MADHAVHDILNELLVEEQCSLAIRLVESNVFVTRVATDELDTVKRMAGACKKHSEWLTDLILALGGLPGPRGTRTTSADLHFQDIRHVLPRLVDDCESLVSLYTRASRHVADEPLAAELVARIRARHDGILGRFQQIA